MANIEYLNEGVTKAAEKVAKCKATIERHHVQLNKKLAAVQKSDKTITLENIEAKKAEYRGTQLGWDLYDVTSKLDDIKGATRKLADAETVLANWQARLDVATEKERFLSEHAPQVIIDFLHQWKEKAREWHIEAHAEYLRTQKDLRAQQLAAMIEAVETIAECRNSSLLDADGKVKEDRKNWSDLVNYNGNRKAFERFMKEKKLTDTHIKAKLASFGAVVARMVMERHEANRLAYLENVLEQERISKMYDLINRVNAVVGTITDASYLCINRKGNLDGFVIGEKGKANVQTIGAGGWNIQCFHYRTLVHAL